MLAMADRRGRVWGSIPGLANRARVSVEACERALEKFKSPDKYSRTGENEGRRVADIEGGWTLLNHGKYRAIRDEEAIKESKRVSIAKRRAREKANVDTNVEKVDRCRDNAEADTESYNTVVIPTAEFQKREKDMTSKEWIAFIASKSEYAHVDVQASYQEMSAFYTRVKRQMTREKFLKWLDNQHVPLEPAAKKIVYKDATYGE
jgi:hypothetical protein